MSRFLIFDVVDDIDNVVDDLDDAFDAADNDDGEIANDEFVDDREDTVEGVESNGDDTTKDEPMTSVMACFFSSTPRPTYRFLSSSGGFCWCLPCLRLMLDLWFLAKEWSSSLAHWKGVSSSHIEVGVLVEIFADALKIYLHVGITYKNKDFFLI